MATHARWLHNFRSSLIHVHDFDGNSLLLLGGCTTEEKVYWFVIGFLIGAVLVGVSVWCYRCRRRKQKNSGLRERIRFVRKGTFWVLIQYLKILMKGSLYL